ncbi:MAG TPA: PDZ domain-containing protein [Pirellulales bacterium]|nr:PDZ domain-containing protein [Pirellulales bacterium]
MLRQRFSIAIPPCMLAVALCGLLANVRAEDAEKSPDALAEQKNSADSVAERLVDQLAAKKWLANGRCVACHFQVPANPHGAPVGQADLDLMHPDLSAANYLLLGLANARQQQSCAECHQQANAAKGPCTRADHCTRDAEAKQKVTYLGVGVEPVPQAVREHVKLPRDVGLMIETVESDSPAARVDLRRYDILEKLDGQLLINQEQFGVLVRMYPPEHAISLELIRANERKTLTAKLGQREVTGSTHGGLANFDVVIDQDSGFVDVGVADSAALRAIEFLQRCQAAPDKTASPQEPAPITYLGISTSPPPAALAEQLKLPAERCLMIDSVEADSPAATAGLKAFDVLEKLDDQLIVNSEQLTVLVRLRKPGEEVTLTLIREGKHLKIKVKLAERGVASHEDDQLPKAVVGDFDDDGSGEVTYFLRGDRLIRYVDVGQGKFVDIAQANPALDDVLTFTVGRNEVSDQEYVRRIYLDLTGALPSAKDAAEFAADDRPDKRKRLVNRLLSRPDVISALGDKAVLQWSDDEHSLTLTTADSGQKRLTAKDHEGKVLFQGLVETDEQRQKLDPRLAIKVAMMLKGYIGTPAAEAPDADALLEKVLPRFSSSGKSLKEVIGELRQATGANIVVEWKSLVRSGVAADEPVEIDLHNVRLRTVLKTLLALAGGEKGRLHYTVDDGVILISADPAH